jgi:hypothetical protein
LWGLFLELANCHAKEAEYVAHRGWTSKLDKSDRPSIYQVTHPKREDRNAVENGLEASQIGRQIELARLTGSKWYRGHCMKGFDLLPDFNIGRSGYEDRY